MQEHRKLQDTDALSIMLALRKLTVQRAR